MRPLKLRQDRRREKRHSVTGVARMAQRTCIILGTDEPTVHPCKILTASDQGYSISLTPMPKLEIGDEFVFEHTDRTQYLVRVCWLSEHEAGLKIVDPDQTTR